MTLASGLGASIPAGIAIDATNVYWAMDSATGDVMKVSLAGGTPVSLSAPTQPSPFDIAVDAKNAYFTLPFDNTVKSVPLGGGAVVTLASGESPHGIAVDSTGVYWANYGGDSVMRVPVGGGTAVTISSGFNGTDVVALDPTFVYFANYGPSGSVARVAK